MKEAQISKCSVIDWQVLKDFLVEMRDQKGESVSSLDQIDLPIISEHVGVCEDCRRKLEDLVGEYKTGRKS